MVRADRGELTKLPGIATFSSLVSLGVVHDQQRAPYDVGWQSSGWSPTPRMWSTHWHLARICRRTCQPREVVGCRVPQEAGFAAAPIFLHHPGQAGGARLRHRVDQLAPYCSSWMGQKYRAGLEAAFWWRRNWWLSLSSSGLTLTECDAVRAATLPHSARALVAKEQGGIKMRK